MSLVYEVLIGNIRIHMLSRSLQCMQCIVRRYKNKEHVISLYLLFIDGYLI